MFFASPQQVILINRVQHIVIPPRAVFHATGHGEDDEPLGVDANFSTRALFALNAVRRRLLPINVKSTRTRLLIMLPALLHSSRTLVLLLISMLQVAQMIPTSLSAAPYIGPIYDSLSEWSLQMDMYHICWMAFTSSCFVVMSGALLAGLEGQCVDLTRE